MAVLKGIFLAVAIFSSLLFVSNLVADAVSVFSWCNTLHSEEEMKNRDRDAENFARYRTILSAVMSVSWTMFIML